MPQHQPVNVLLIGGGGREHALALQLARSPRLGDLWITHPDNPGLAALGKPVDVPVDARELYRLVQFCDKKQIGLVVIGPEDPLAEGYADRLAGPGRLVFGPGRDAARLEADKAWAKQLMRSASIPTAEARTFTDAQSARGFLESRSAQEPSRTLAQSRGRPSREAPDVPFEYVIKAAGLAKGKGVFVPETLEEAFDALDRLMNRGEFGEAGRRVVIEERLTGPEVSVLAIVDGRSILVLPPCQDHKRLGEGDTGPNTGGMGAFCPTPLLDEPMMEKVEREILVPTLDALRREGIEYCGVLYAGLMLTHAGPKVLEFNVRFGDPECQPLMARFKGDLLETMLAACEGRLAAEDAPQVEWDTRTACTIVLASGGYPEKPRTGLPIAGLEEAEAMPDVVIHHAGTKRDAEGRIITAGGRVLSVTGLGENMEAARRAAYAACDRIHFDGMVLRRDIGAGAAQASARK